MMLVALCLAMVVALWLSRPAAAPAPAASRSALGLFTSLPIMWGEAPDVGAMLAGPAKPHWVRLALERRYRLIPLDTLNIHGAAPASTRLLMMAQPRPLSPQENVALDRWVRGGGRLLLFADPMLTFDSVWPIGDRRRPQDIVLLSPILARWGLELRFDEAQPAGLREIAGRGLPVNLPGRLVSVPGGHDARCFLSDAGLVARCRIGAGGALIVADAALLESGGDDDGRRAAMLDRLLDEARAD